ncbi:MAG: hypothetical protein ACE5KA_04335 [Nitrososphaerales archaeon]
MVHQRPIFDEKLVSRFEYDINIIRFIDDKPNRMFNMLVIHPIEVGNRFEFKSKENTSLRYYVPIEHITEVGTPEQTEGMSEKKDLLLNIEFKDSQGNKKSIAFNIQDKYIEEILVKTLKPMEQKYWDTVDLEYNLDGEAKTTQLYYKTPFLSEGEELLWINTKTEGIVNKHLRWLEALTNFRALYYDFEKHESGRIPLSFVDDIIVKNERTTERNRYGSFTARGISSLARNKMSTTQESDRTIGDVYFMRDGKPIVTFVQISEPYGLVTLAKSVIAQLFTSVKSRKTRLPVVEGPVIAVKTSAKGEPICSHCGNVNQIGSEFCSTCGFGLR